jgi:outer membrane lipoprotein
MKRYSLLICLLVTACSNLPPAIKNPPLYDITYSQAIQNINNHKHAPVRWGGTIIDVENEQNFTLVQVLSYPLGSSGRPQLDEANEGRFIFKSAKFLDPVVYAKDKEITVAGTLEGDVERTIGKKILRLPLISSTVIYLWPDYYRNYYGGYGGFGYGYGYYPYYGYYGYPYYWGGYYRPYRGWQ